MAGRRRPHHLLLLLLPPLLLLGHDLLVLLLEHQLLLVMHVLLQLLVRVMGSLHGLGRRMRGAGRPNGPGGGTTSLLLLMGARAPRECSSLVGRHAEQGVAVRLDRLHRLLEDIPVRVIAAAAAAACRRPPGLIHGVEQRLRKEELRLLLSGGDGGARPDLPGRSGCSGRTLPGVLGRTGGDEGGGARGGEPAARPVRHDRLLLPREALLLVPKR